MIKIEDIVLDGKESNNSGRQMPAMTEEEKDILQHHGIIGMRWGKGRKTKVPKQTVAPKAKGVNEAAREQQFKSEYANRDKMSTRSLQNRVKRLQAEQQFKELVNKPAAERAKAAAAIAEKKRKRNKMLLRTALGIYGNVPMDSFGKKGKDLKEILGPSQAIAKAAATSDALKNSESLDNILLHKGIKDTKGKHVTIDENDVILHYGVKGMRRGIRKQIIAAGGRRDVKLLKKQNTAAIKIYKANKLNYKVAKSNFKSNRNKINKTQYKIARKMYKGAKVAKKAQMNASKIRSQELVEKYLKQYDNSDILLHKGINKTDVILHSSRGVELQELHHGFKYKSKHKNKKGKWIYVYDDIKENVGDLFDKNATVNISKKVNTDYSGKDLSNAIKSVEKSANKSISGNSYDKSQTYTNSIDSIKPIGKGLTKKITGTVNVRKKGTIHKTYDSVLKNLGF